MDKPTNHLGYTNEQAEACERTLVTLFRGIGPWKDAIVLIGGLAPRYLVNQHQQPGIPPHVGTSDVDLVLNFSLLSDISAYRRLEQNLQHLGFARGSNDEGNPRHFSWAKRVEGNTSVVVDLLCDVAIKGGRVTGVPNEKHLSAISIPGASLALQDNIGVNIRAQLLDDRGFTEESIRVANIAPFIVLKSLAYDQRFERKDAYDLIYCLQFYKTGPLDAAREVAKLQRRFPEEHLIPQAVEIMRNRFASDEHAQGAEKDGPVSYAQFQAASDQSALQARLRQEAAAVVELFLDELKRLLDTESL